MSPEYDSMKRSILRTIGKDSCRDVVRGGADAGFPGFTYYNDTVRFYDRHKKAIWELLNDMADSMGEKNTMALIASFTRAADISDDDTFKNLLAWFALEEVCRRYEDGER